MSTGKQWRQHERDTMQSLGLKPTPLSGGGWIAKEDGENDHVIAQLKSTEGKSISVKKLDLDQLAHHGRVSRKLPVFVLSFVGSEPWVACRASQIKKAARHLSYDG